MFGLVPLGVEVLVVQSEVGAQVDDVSDPAADLWNDRHADAVRQANEDQIEAIDRLGSERVIGAVAICSGKARVEISDRSPRLGVAGCHHELEVGVASDEAEKFGSRVARGSHDADTFGRCCRHKA